MTTDITEHKVLLEQLKVSCSKCSYSFVKPSKYTGKNLMCRSCRYNKNDSKHFICNGCNIAVNFQEETIPDYCLIGIRTFCSCCIQYYFYRQFNQFCELCCIPFTSKYRGHKSLCTKCRMGCVICASHKDLVFGISFKNLAINYDLTPQCYCRSCYDASNVFF